MPINELHYATAVYDIHSLQLGVLDLIEMIRGPGSTIYGADAFHGVVSLKTFESAEDLLDVDLEYGSDAYRQVAVRSSSGVGNGRVNAAVSYSGQGDMDIAYDFTDTGGSRIRSSRAMEYDSIMGVLKWRSEGDPNSTGRFGMYFKAHDQDEFPGVGRVTALP